MEFSEKSTFFKFNIINKNPHDPLKNPHDPFWVMTHSLRSPALYSRYIILCFNKFNN